MKNLLFPFLFAISIAYCQTTDSLKSVVIKNEYRDEMLLKAGKLTNESGTFHTYGLAFLAGGTITSAIGGAYSNETALYCGIGLSVVGLALEVIGNVKQIRAGNFIIKASTAK